MIDFQTEMDRVVTNFVGQISDLARRAAMEMLTNSLGGKSTARRAVAAPRRGAKRSGADLDRLRDQLVAFIAKHPGLRIEQINKELGTTTRDLALPIRKLVADGTVKTKGKKRSTTYFAK